MEAILKKFLTQYEEPCEVISEFPVLHEGWEGDSTGWVISVGTRKILVLTTHGSPYEATEAELVERINFYGRVIDSTLAAMKTLEGA